MRRLALMISAAVLSSGGSLFAQAVSSPRVSDYYAAPGLYGTSYGYASYGVPRTTTSFSALPWSGYYGSNTPGYGYMPGRFGVGLWRPGFTAPGYVNGVPTSADSYRTFPVTAGTGLTASEIAPPPPMGVYAPTLGPGVGRYDE